MEKEQKKESVEYECTNCQWNGTELSKSCKTLGNIKENNEHKVIDGVQRCDGCGYLDNKCPVCGDETGKPGIREKIRAEKEEAQKRKEADLNGGAYL